MNDETFEETVYRMLTRDLQRAENLLAELTSVLALGAREDVHQALLKVETMARIERKEHSVHVTGNRDAA